MVAKIAVQRLTLLRYMKSPQSWRTVGFFVCAFRQHGNIGTALVSV